MIAAIMAIDQEKGFQAAADARAEILRIIEEKRSIKKAMTRLDEALDATEVKVFCSQGEIVYSSPLVAHKIRLQASSLTLQLADAMPSEKHDHRVSLGANEMQLAAQIARKVLNEEPRE